MAVRNKTKSIVERISRHFNSAGGSLYIPEWDITVYWKPASIAEQEAVAQTCKTDSMWERSLRTMIFRLKDEKGERVFNLGDYHVLANEADTAIINRILLAMTADEYVTEQEASEAILDPPSITSTTSPESMG